MLRKQRKVQSGPFRGQSCSQCEPSHEFWVNTQKELLSRALAVQEMIMTLDIYLYSPITLTMP